MPNKDKYGQGDKPDEKKPLRKPKVKVRANPRDKGNEGHRDVAKKVRKGFKEKVEKVLKENKGGGHERQLDAAEKAVEKEAAKVDGGAIRKVKVKIEGDIEGPDGRPLGVEKVIEAEPNG
ncbi:MAG: hypothetical protein U9Q03_06320 [Patescibacteria group bacterium]|nr:hypothetical protein [Patescibacteria group bacterium]